METMEIFPCSQKNTSQLEILAPGSDARYLLLLHMGVAAQVRCIVSWEDQLGIHENVATLRFF